MEKRSYNIFFGRSSIMEFTQNDEALPERLKKKKGLLVVRIHMKNLEEAHPFRNFLLKEKSNHKSKSKQKSCPKRRTSSMKIFAKAHVAS